VPVENLAGIVASLKAGGNKQVAVLKKVIAKAKSRIAPALKMSASADCDAAGGGSCESAKIGLLHKKGFLDKVRSAQYVCSVQLPFLVSTAQVWAVPTSAHNLLICKTKIVVHKKCGQLCGQASHKLSKRPRSGAVKRLFAALIKF
jgi:hypothetical protein